MQALREALPLRPAHRLDADERCVFITTKGNRWVKCGEKGGSDNQITKAFGRLLDDLELKRPGLSFYSLRHVFQTVADGARDPVAVSSIMGHVDGTMAGHYREGIGDDRLRAVTDHVRNWLFGK